MSDKQNTVLISPNKPEIMQQPEHKPRKRRMPALDLPCPECGGMSVRKGLRFYKHVGREIERFHCSGPGGCKTYHMRDPATWDVVEAPKRKKSGTKGRNRLRPADMEDFLAIAKNVAEFLEGSDENDRESLAEPFREQLDTVETKMLPHVRRPVIEDPTNMAAHILGITGEEPEKFVPGKKGQAGKLIILDLTDDDISTLGAEEILALDRIRTTAEQIAGYMKSLHTMTHKRLELQESKNSIEEGA